MGPDICGAGVITDHCQPHLVTSDSVTQARSAPTPGVIVASSVLSEPEDGLMVITSELRSSNSKHTLIISTLSDHILVITDCLIGV